MAVWTTINNISKQNTKKREAGCLFVTDPNKNVNHLYAPSGRMMSVRGCLNSKVFLLKP